MFGLLFDLDGTLALTNPVHELAWRQVLAEHGIQLSPAEFTSHISGRSNREIVAHFLPGLDAQEAEYVARIKEQVFRQLAGALRAPLGLEDFVQRSHEAGNRLAVVTNAPRANADHVLRTLGLQALFPVLVAEEDVTNPKPNPEPYELAARIIDLPHERCLAFEDSPSGIRAAVDAGIMVVGLLTTHAEPELLAAGAHVVASDFSQPALLEWVRGFLAQSNG